MAWQQPLTPFIVHVADPPELPVRAPGDPGPQRVISAKPVASGDGSLTLAARLSDGPDLVIEVEAAAEGVIRVRLAQDGTVRPRATRVVELAQWARPPDATTVLSDSGAVVDAGSVRAEISFGPWGLRFTDAAGRLLVEENTGESDISQRLRVLPFGRSTGRDGTCLAYHETFALRSDEHLCGLGEKFTEFDKRGQRVVSWNYDAFSAESERSYKNIPLYLSNRGYGILVHSGSAIEFDLGHSTHSCVQIVVPDDILEYFLIGGPAPADVLRRYHALTGRPVPPPKWAVGAWISTGYLPADQRQTLAEARRIRDSGVPCDVLHLDAYWQRRQHWSSMEWDPERYPDPVEMLRDLRAMGFRVCLWINPYISVRSPLFGKAAEDNRFLCTTNGSVYVADTWHGAIPPCGIVDFTDPASRAWFQSLLRPLLLQGVTAFKTDFGEGVPADAVSHSGLRGVDLHNVYPLLFNDAVADVTEEVAGHRVVWARSSFTGGQRHCAQWAGDTNSTWSSMASTLRGGLSYAVSGVPYWSHDVGGFTGVPSPELMVRSAQFGALSPMLRFHGTSSRFPWDFGAAAEVAVGDAVRLRYRLMPYLYSAVVEAADSGYPVMRPLVVEAPGEPGSWSAGAEYLLGPDLLVAPMTVPEGERHVYLPPGRWVDFWAGEVFDGGRHVRITRPLEHIPLFVRAGALIVMTPPADTVGDGPFADVSVACWGCGKARVTVHDVVGATRVRTALGAAGELRVESEGPMRIRDVAFPPVAGSPIPATVTVNGTAMVWTPGAPWPTATVVGR